MGRERLRGHLALAGKLLTVRTQAFQDVAGAPHSSRPHINRLLGEQHHVLLLQCHGAIRADHEKIDRSEPTSLRVRGIQDTDRYVRAGEAIESLCRQLGLPIVGSFDNSVLTATVKGAFRQQHAED